MSAGCRKFAMVLCHTLLYLGGAIPQLSHAVTPVEQAFIDGQAAAQSAASGASASITNGTIANTVNSFNPSYYNFSGTAPEAGYFMNGGGDTITPGAGKVTACQTGPVNPNAFLQQNCDAISYMARNPTIRPQFTISPGDPNVARSRSIEANPATLAANSLGYASPSAIGAFTGCTTQTITTPPTYTTEVCNEYLNAISHICTVGRTIVVDAQSNFQCNETANVYETLKCRRSSSVACTGGGDGCDQGGVVPNSWEGDMATTWLPDGAGNYILQFGTIADNYWGGWGAVYDRNLTFEARDISLITRFALTRAAYDDWLLVKINGTTVYVGPRGGDRLYVIDTGAPINASFCTQNDWGGQWSCYQNSLWGGGQQLIGTYSYCQCNGWDTCTWYCNNDGPPGYVRYGPLPSQYSSPELSTSWNFTLDIDLRPYLKNGSNTIFMRTIVAGGGEGAIQITARQKCPLNCSVSTNNQCATLEARSQ